MKDGFYVKPADDGQSVSINESRSADGNGSFPRTVRRIAKFEVSHYLSLAQAEAFAARCSTALNSLESEANPNPTKNKGKKNG